MLTEPEIFAWYSPTKQIEDFFVREFARDEDPFERTALLPIYGKRVIGGKYKPTG
jgi:hypothetical protein